MSHSKTPTRTACIAAALATLAAAAASAQVATAPVPTATNAATLEAPPALPGTSAAPPSPPPAPPPAPTVAAAPTAAGARYHDFLDTRLTWTFGDDDVLAATGQRVPVSPLPRIGDRPGYQLFFDALNTRFAGRENLTHLVMYARAPGFIPRFVTEASLVLRFDLGQLTSGSGNLNQALYDAGTYLRLQYQTNPARPADGLSLTFFPFDTDRFRLGWLWDISWGDNNVFPRKVGPTPGFRLAFDHGNLGVYAGFKTGGIVVPLQAVTSSTDIETVRVEESQYAALAGVGYRATDWFRFDVGGGFFQQGRLAFPGVTGLPAWLAGGSARVVFSQGINAAQSIDMLLYRNHADFPMQLFAMETYTPGRVTWLVSAEGTILAQQLADADRFGATGVQPGAAAALQGRIKYGYLGVGVTGLFRDVPFILRNVPSFVPYALIPRSATTTPEGFFAASVDYRIRSANVTPSLIVGLQLPASFYSTVTEGSLMTQRTLVIRRAGNFSILPPGETAVPIVSARVSVRWDLSTIFAIVGWIQYVRDANGTLLQVDATGARQVRVFQAADQLGMGLVAQARY